MLKSFCFGFLLASICETSVYGKEPAMDTFPDLSKKSSIQRMQSTLANAQTTAQNNLDKTAIDETQNRSVGPRDLDIFKTVPHVPGAPANYAMNFMTGSWTGRIGSTAIEEYWSKCEGRDWIGVRKLSTDVKKTTIYLFNFRGSGSSIIAFMRKFEEDLNEASNPKRVPIKNLDNFEKNKTSFESGAERFSYQLLENGNLKTIINGQSVELEQNRQKSGAP